MSSLPRIPMNLRIEQHDFPTLKPRYWGAIAILVGLHCARHAEGAEKPRSVDGDVFTVDAQASTYIRFFQRSLTPGPAGSIVTDDRLLPIYETFSLRVAGLDSPLQLPNSIDFELGAWGGYTTGQLSPGERALDGDLSVANVVHRFGGAYVRMGRQIEVGGAARFAQFDGVSLGYTANAGSGSLGLDLYAGATVLPRWSSRPGYFQLGSAADTLLRYPQALPQPNRWGTWQSGVRAHGAIPHVGGAGISFHEQRENNQLGSRRMALDLFLNPLEEATLSMQAMADLDSQRLSDGRVWLDFYPARHLSASLEYLRTDPALFLSKQSVLSVFATDPFSEVGADIDYHPTKSLLLAGSAYVERFDLSGVGARVQSRIQAKVRQVTLQLQLGRVADPRVGYYTSRASVRWELLSPCWLTVDQFYYFYDQPIQGTNYSAVEAATIEWRLSQAANLAASGSVTQSPYSTLDTKGLLSLVLDLSSVRRRSTP